MIINKKISRSGAASQRVLIINNFKRSAAARKLCLPGQYFHGLQMIDREISETPAKKKIIFPHLKKL
jgi:hypothetical protein